MEGRALFPKGELLVSKIFMSCQIFRVSGGEVILSKGLVTQ